MNDDLKSQILSFLDNYDSESKRKFESIVEVFNSEFGEANVDGTIDACSPESIFNFVRNNVNTESQEVLMDKLKHHLDRIYSSILTIIVRFPVVKVTNEEDKFVIIKDLYALIRVYDGLLQDSFTLQRTTFSKLHWQCGYAHSHLPSLTGWQNPCLGTGPIENTQRRLMRSYDLELWGLFCYELSKYVTVESLRGVPYKRLESIGNRGMCVDLKQYRVSADSLYIYPVSDFLKYWVHSHTIKVGYINGQYVLGEDTLSFWIKLSKDFINWYNIHHDEYGGYDNMGLDYLQIKHIILKCIISGRTIYKWGRSNIDYSDYAVPQNPMLKFKGRDVYVVIEDEDREEELSKNVVYLLDPVILNSLLTMLYECANYNQRKDRIQEGSKEDSPINREYKIFQD